jgi:hypothetical protein
MIMHNPGGRLAVCGEAARIVDSVFVIMNRNDVLLEDGEGHIVVFRTQAMAHAYRQKTLGDHPEEIARWSIFEFYSRDVDLLIATRPHRCLGEDG